MDRPGGEARRPLGRTAGSARATGGHVAGGTRRLAQRALGRMSHAYSAAGPPSGRALSRTREIPGRSHHAVFGPGVPSAGGVFLVLCRCRLVNRLGIKGGVDGAQSGNDVGILVADVADLEEIAVHVEDLETVFPDAHVAQRAQLRARALEELQRRVKGAGKEIVSSEWRGHVFLRRLRRRARSNWITTSIFHASATPQAAESGVTPEFAQAPRVRRIRAMSWMQGPTIVHLHKMPPLRRQTNLDRIFYDVPNRAPDFIRVIEEHAPARVGSPDWVSRGSLPLLDDLGTA